MIGTSQYQGQQKKTVFSIAALEKFDAYAAWTWSVDDWTYRVEGWK